MELCNKVVISAPFISRAMAANARLKPSLKIIGTSQDRRVVAVDDSRRISITSMIIYPGFLVSPRAETEPVEADELMIKILSPAGEYYEEKDYFMLEKEIIERLSGLDGVPQVVAEGNVSTELDRYPFFAMRKIEGEDFNKFILEGWKKKPPPRDEVVVLTQTAFPALAERLASIHDRGVVHRDIKPNNILFDGKTNAVAVLDFGRANYLDAAARKDVGTDGYYPVELGKEEMEDVRTDVYGLGATCFTILTGKGVCYEGVQNIWFMSRMERRLFGAQEIIQSYYDGIDALRSKSPDELLRLVNMPPDLKETKLGKYLLRLIHPDKEQRPTNMGKIAENLRRYGAELDEHIIW